MRSPVGRVALLLFGSGLCALVYQVAWLRELRLIFGASTAASAAVLAVFMGGLGAGGIVLGRRAARSVRPLQLYAQLELAIAATAAVTPVIVALLRWLYAAMGGTVTLGLVGGTVVRLLLAVIILLVPTFLMGGTLPAAAQAIETAGDTGRRRLAVLYGVNTIGAVAGTLLSTFALQEILGTRRMLWAACALNALVGLSARAIARQLPARDPSLTGLPAPAPSAGRPAPRLVLIAAAVVGFAFLLMELVWYRMLGPLLGGSSFTFGLILAVALAGIGLGGGAYALFGGRRAPTLVGFAITCGAEAALIALPFALGDRIALWTALLRALGSLGFFGQVMGWTAIASVVVLPPAFVAGVQFPLLIALLGEGDADVGRQVGQAYAWNTAGAILGSLAGGFGLLPLLSAPGAWKLVVILLAGLGLAAVAVALRTGGKRARAFAPALLGVIAIAFLLARGPTAAWRHGAIGAARGPTSGSPNSLEAWARAMRRAVVWEADGVESSVALDGEAGLAFVVNGKIDGNARSDAPTQVMSGLIGAMLHPQIKKAMVIGLGTGSTAGWLGVVPGVERVDVAELEPAILRVADACEPVNRAVRKNPKVHLFLGDARELLSTTRERYDLVFSEPSNPYRAGISSLFTQDFYRAVGERLEKGGLFLQWVQAYSVDPETVRSVYATVASVFPQVETWVTEEADLLLVASMEPLPVDVARLKQRIGEEPFRTALAHVWRVDDVEGVLAHYAARSSMAQAIAQADADAVNTDDQTLVEFGFARGVGRRESAMRTNDLRELARARREDRPVLVNGSVDWALVDERKQSMVVAQEQPTSGLPQRLPDAAVKRGLAMSAWLGSDFPLALAQWQSQPGEPRDLVEVPVVAESLAARGDEAALPLLTRLRAFSPALGIEADVIEARLRIVQNRLPEATELLTRAFTAYRTNPWPLSMVMVHALTLPIQIARRDHALGERLFGVLAQPFAVEMLTSMRENTRVELALAIDFKRLCVEALKPFEPEAQWKRDFLVGRAECYRLNNHPLQAQADADLARFQSREPLPFSTGLR